MEAPDPGPPGSVIPYHSPRGLYPFQSELVGYCYARRNNLAVVDTGLGKSHIAMATAALLIADAQIDLVLVLCEGNKINEWVDDFREFTSIPAVKYKGDLARRGRLTERLCDGDLDRHVLVTTYHTFREDALDGGSAQRPTRLFQGLRARRVFVICDEMTVVAGRTSGIHKAVANLSAKADARVLGLTATPITKSIESLYNLGRILCPDLVGTVARFEREHVAVKDRFDRPWKFKNEALLAEKMAPVLLRKRKTEPDVRHLFPEPIEDFIPIPLADDHKAMYDRLHELFQAHADEDGNEPRSAFSTLQRFANHPASILTSNSAFAAEFLADVPRETIAKLTCSKSDEVVRKVRTIIDQGDQVAVFCDSVQVLQALEADLRRHKIDPSLFHGGVSDDRCEADKQAFKRGEKRVILLSSRGERGINLPEASYIINYDVPLMHSTYIQRYSRGSRIAEGGEVLVVTTYMAHDTVETGAASAWMSRNKQSDRAIDNDIPDGDAFVTAAARSAMIRESRKRLEHQDAA